MAASLTTERCTSWPGDSFAACRELYRSAFPQEERRSMASQRLLVSEETRYHCLRLDAGGCFAGLLFYWQHPEFIYVEHLAITPARRGQGLGRRALEFICGQGLPVILEMEYVVDEVTERRWHFYQAAGFHCLPYQHLQPCYNHGDPPVKLALMSYPHAMGLGEMSTFELFMKEAVARYTEDALRARPALNA